jgi:choline monooxygenase
VTEPDAPLTTLPAAWYHDPAHYAAERVAVFGTEWQLVGAESQVAEPQSHLALDLAGWPIVVARDADGGLRAFHNVCRHRAGPLVDDGCGSGSRFVCRYHGWAYALDGRLTNARDFGDDDLDLDQFGLLPVAVEAWRGLLFVNLAPHPPPLVPWLGGFAEQAASFPMEEFAFSHQFHHDVGANWKAYADNYMEGYHLPLVHPELTREVDAARYRVIVGDHHVVHEVPPRDGAINAGRWLWRYPNLALNLYPDAMNIEQFVPLGPDRTRIVYRYFFRDPSQRDEEVERISKVILEEDRLICEAVQRNLEAGQYDTGRLSPRHENGVAAFQGWVAESLSRAGGTGAPGGPASP